MIEIEYYLGPAYGEPGPNFVWRGRSIDIQMIVNKISDLISGRLQEVVIQTDTNHRLIGCERVLLQMHTDGRILTQLRPDGTVLSDLPAARWQHFVDLLVELTNGLGFQYLEIEDSKEYSEDAQWIVESLDNDGKPGRGQSPS